MFHWKIGYETCFCIFDHACALYNVNYSFKLNYIYFQLNYESSMTDGDNFGLFGKTTNKRVQIIFGLPSIVWIVSSNPPWMVEFLFCNTWRVWSSFLVAQKKIYKSTVRMISSCPWTVKIIFNCPMNNGCYFWFIKNKFNKFGSNH